MMRFGFADKIVAKLLLWRQVALQRDELSRLSDELLKDIGISRAEATREAHRPFWDTAPLTREYEQCSSPKGLSLKYQ